MNDPIELSEAGAVRRSPGPGLTAREPDSAGFAETLRVLRRRWATIVSLVVIGLAAATLVSVQMTPRYSAVATVLLDPRDTTVVEFENVVSNLPSDEESVNSEILVIGSPLLTARVTRALNLASAPEFNPTLTLAGGLDAIGEAGELLGSGFEAPLAEEAALRRLHSRVLAEVRDHLKVTRAGRSRAIDIRFTSADPDIAARFANALADTYLADQLHVKTQAAKSAQNYLQSRIDTLRSQVQAAEQAIEDFRINAGLVGTPAGTIAAQQLTGLSTQLVLARTKRAEAEARLRQARRLTDAGDIESAAEVLASPLIVDMRGREGEAERRIAELSDEYGERHPAMISARAELRDIRQRIAAEVAKIVISLENEVAVARVREGAIAGNVATLETTAANQGEAEVQVRSLEREAEAARSLFEQFLVRASETETQADIQRSDSRILARAEPPTEPAFPNPNVILPIAAGISLAIGIALAFLLEQFDSGYRSGEQVERDTGAPLLALSPTIPRRRRLRMTPEQYVLDRPTSAFAESLRSIDTGVRLSNVDRPPKSVLITSSTPKEGKTTLALALGRLTAQAGRNVILVDADLRRPRIAQALGLEGEFGLTEVLAGEADLDAALQRDEPSGLFVLSAGRHRVPNAPDLLGSQQMRDTLRRLEETFDMVIVDSAPLLAVSDSRALARHVDAVVFIAKWADTRRQVVQTALRQLRDAGAKVSGVVLTAVNVRRHAHYSYGDSGYYYGDARRYFQN